MTISPLFWYVAGFASALFLSAVAAFAWWVVMSLRDESEHNRRLSDAVAAQVKANERLDQATDLRRMFQVNEN